MELEILEKNIGYKFKNKTLLKNALTHRSYAFENNIPSNEKLEFLGDSILEFISSKYLYNTYPDLKEGEMTKVRATIVCEDSLYEIAKHLNFGDFLYLGKSEIAGHDEIRKAIMADSVEAVIAAMYFDGGLEAVEKFIIVNLREAAEEATKHIGEKDYKTLFQEELQKHGDVKIEYNILKEEGPDHNKRFTAEVRYNGRFMAEGEGKSKKAAEMEAARKALESIKEA